MSGTVSGVRTPARVNQPLAGTSGGSLIRFGKDFLDFAGIRAFHAAILVLLGAVLEGFGLLLLIPLLSVILGSGAGEGTIDRFARWVLDLAPMETSTGKLLFILAIFAVLMVVRGLVLLRRDVLLARLQVGFIHSARMNVIQLLSNARWSTVSRLQHSRVTHMLGSDMFNLRTVIGLLIQSSVALVMLSLQVLLAFLLSPLLALLVLSLLAMGAFALRPVLQKSKDLGMVVMQANLSALNSAGQFLGGLKYALSQNLQGSFVAEFNHVLSDGAQSEIAFARQRSITGIALTALAAAVAALMMLIGSAVLELAAPSLLALLVILARMNGPAAQIQHGAQQIFHSLPIYGKMKTLMDELQRGRSSDSDATFSSKRIRGDVEFQGVGFWHEAEDGSNQKRGVSGVTLKIPEGCFVGLKGESGAGKTTFADLLVGLYAPQTGIILVSGTPLEGATLARWRNSVSYVPQDPFMFHDSIRRNLLWAAPSASEEELWRALSAAGAQDFVQRSPLGLDTVLGERGTLISGGERQRIALARALLRSPSLLILDEATNAIDVLGEQAILQRLSEMEPRPTILIIAHREASLSLCELVLEFRQGQLVGA
jgi:ATP-binding cassette subfamily C protein